METKVEEVMRMLSSTVGPKVHYWLRSFKLSNLFFLVKNHFTAAA